MSRRRATASAHTRTSTEKTKKQSKLDGLYIGTDAGMAAVVNNGFSLVIQGTSSTTDNTIIEYLQRIEQSNQNLMRRVDQLEQERLVPLISQRSHEGDLPYHGRPALNTVTRTQGQGYRYSRT